MVRSIDVQPEGMDTALYNLKVPPSSIMVEDADGCL